MSKTEAEKAQALALQREQARLTPQGGGDLPRAELTEVNFADPNYTGSFVAPGTKGALAVRVDFPTGPKLVFGDNKILSTLTIVAGDDVTVTIGRKEALAPSAKFPQGIPAKPWITHISKY